MERKNILLVALLVAILLAGTFAFIFIDQNPRILPSWREDDPPNITIYGPGQKRHLLLGNSTNGIVVEIDYVAGYEPSQHALNTLLMRMQEITGKTIKIEMGSQIPGMASYSRNDLENIESQYRNNPEKDGMKASVYVLYLNGAYNGNQGVLGVAYNGTSMAIMKEQVDSISIPAPLQRTGLSTEDFEASVIVHEMGHLWGLVNIGYESERDYEDPEHPHHSKHQDCVMYWAIETSPSSYMRPGSERKPPTTFHEDALFDLEKIKSGEY